MGSTCADVCARGTEVSAEWDVAQLLVEGEVVLEWPGHWARRHAREEEAALEHWQVLAGMEVLLLAGSKTKHIVAVRPSAQQVQQAALLFTRARRRSARMAPQAPHTLAPRAAPLGAPAYLSSPPLMLPTSCVAARLKLSAPAQAVVLARESDESPSPPPLERTGAPPPGRGLSRRSSDWGRLCTRSDPRNIHVERRSGRPRTGRPAGAAVACGAQPVTRASPPPSSGYCTYWVDRGGLLRRSTNDRRYGFCVPE